MMESNIGLIDESDFLIEERMIYELSKAFEAIIVKIAQTNEIHFKVVYASGRRKISTSRIGKELMRLVKKSEGIARDFEASEMFGPNPFSRLFLDCVRGYRDSYEASDPVMTALSRHVEMCTQLADELGSGYQMMVSDP
tara:strand:- start:32 stop:448 length:417 start_codon:yes stop_codon:yes gene_type:complete